MKELQKENLLTASLYMFFSFLCRTYRLDVSAPYFKAKPNVKNQHPWPVASYTIIECVFVFEDALDACLFRSVLGLTFSELDLLFVYKVLISAAAATNISRACALSFKFFFKFSGKSLHGYFLNMKEQNFSDHWREHFFLQTFSLFCRLKVDHSFNPKDKFHQDQFGPRDDKTSMLCSFREKLTYFVRIDSLYGCPPV